MSLLSAPDQVLATLNRDGTRRKLDPRVSRGRFYQARRWVAYGLIALFVLLPYVKLGGKPAILLDLVHREFTFFGATFRPADGFILMLFGLTLVLSVFLITAVAGRVWCGWGCPQTVYLEWVFRPIERRLKQHRVLMWGVFALLSFGLAHTFLAYFVGASTVSHWVRTSPALHPVGFGVVVVVTGLMFFDFAYFREQTCAIACPYGRLQSVLLDEQSLIIGYDTRRGEPRGKLSKKLPVIQEPRGDCIDCRACVTTCPAGIDIRNGLQMECIACAQCIDACDAIMDRVERPRGLIRYTAQAELAGGVRKLWRTRTLLYPIALVAVLVLFVGQLGGRTEADVWVLRAEGAPFSVLTDGTVSTPVRVKIENRSSEARTYRVEVEGVPGARVIDPRGSYPLAAGATTIVPLFVIAPRAAYQHGRHPARVIVRDDRGWSTTLAITVLGPEGTP